MTTKVFCVKVRCRKKKGGSEKMFTVIRSNHPYLESLKSAAPDYKKEWGFSFF